MNVNINKLRLLSILAACLMIYSTIAYVLVNPMPKEQFFQLYVLGSKHMIGDYYPSNTTTITPNTNVSWYIGVTNFMGSIQYVLIKAKLCNLTIQPPNQTLATPSPAPEIATFKRVLLDNETWEFPFTWSIKSVEKRGESVYLNLEINGVEIGVVNVAAVKGSNFRIIFELWTYDFDSGEFIFGWKTKDERRAAWVQLWFNTTLTKP